MFIDPVNAQEVDFDVPTEINIIQGRLSVAFHDGVGKQDATVLMKTLGYPVLQTHFYDWRSEARSSKMLSEEQVRDIKETPGVLNVSQTALGNIHTTTASNAPASSAYLIVITFASHISRNAAKEVLKPFSDFEFTQIASPANEMVIEVGDQDEVALAVLQTQQQVKWVTYVGVGSGG